MTIFQKRLAAVPAMLLFAALLPAQSHVQNRILKEITGSEFSSIQGNVHPLARPEFDQGRVDDSLMLQHITLMFKPSPAQQSDLKVLLDQLQDPSSPQYHKWLTPEQFGSRFGLSPSDANKVESWLGAEGFTVERIARSRMWVVFSGTAGRVSSALHTEIHRYVVNGEAHYANATQPSVPSAMAGVVLGFRGLNDFRPRPRVVARRITASPRFTSSISGDHFLTPNDFATIYDVTALYNAGLDGTGQKVAVMGQTDLPLTDIETFRTNSELPANDPTVILIPGSPDPGVSQNDIGEADLDVEWAGAVAPKATIVYVNSGTANGAFDSLQYAIDQDVAPVAVITYGLCEQQWDTASLQSTESQVQQANSEGITVVAPSGDDGAADCDSPANPSTVVTVAKQGLSVDYPASSPDVTGVGGTEFNEGSGSYWSATNNAENGSALSYIPEMAWNDTNSTNGLSASGGGASVDFSKPSWQTGAGVPSDNARDVPDISFDASPSHDGYLVCQHQPAGSLADCTNGFRRSDTTLDVIGGTSAGAPLLGGVLALINQETNSAQGNINYILYPMAAQDPAAFHDITAGSNIVPCQTGTPACPASGNYGFNAGPGYDQVTGLGTPDVANLVTDWTRFSPTTGASPDFQLFVSPGSVAISSAAAGTATITVTSINGFTGSVSFSCAVPSSLQATCALSPSSVSPSSSSAKASTALTVTSTRSGALLPQSRKPGAGPAGGLLVVVMAAVLLCALGGLIGSVSVRHRPWARVAAVSGVLLCLVALTINCGGGGNGGGGGTPPLATLTGNIVISATSGTISHTIQVSVTEN